MSASSRVGKRSLQGWFSEKEAVRVKVYCARHGLTIADFVRRAVLEALKKGPDQDGQPEDRK